MNVKVKKKCTSTINEYENRKIEMQYKINKHKNNIWLPPLDTKYNIASKINSWFSILESKPQNVTFVNGKYNIIKKENVKYKSKEIILNLTKQQKLIINTWLNSYLDMYNVTLKYIKNNIKANKNVLNYIYTRGKLLVEKQELINSYNKIMTRKSKKINIKVHDIDYAIKLACSNWKSALTNFKMGNIKHFRVRYWKKQKTIKIMGLEKNNFKSGSIRKLILGQVKGTYNGKQFKFNSINCDCRIKRENDKYFLYVPENINLDEIKINNKKSKQITIDLGLRKFASCITENKIVKIGEECREIIKEYLLRKDKILNNEEISDKIKKKNELLINRKIKNLVKEMHWKTINYLVNNYDNILIGDLSAKGIISKNGVLNKMTKRIAMYLSFCEFRQRLKYKCDINKVKYGLINEWMTSKMCSRCGKINEKLGGNKIFKCQKCKLTIDRDINGARNIHIKARK